MKVYLCACMCKCISWTCELILHKNCRVFILLLEYVIPLGIIALDVHWIINKKLKVLIQDLLMAQTFNPSPWIQSIITIITIIIRQVIAIYENFSEG